MRWAEMARLGTADHWRLPARELLPEDAFLGWFTSPCDPTYRTTREPTEGAIVSMPAPQTRLWWREGRQRLPTVRG